MALKKNIEDQVLDKLDIIVKLLGHLVAVEHETMEMKAFTLNSLGLKPNEIAMICDTTPATVNARLADARKKRKS